MFGFRFGGIREVKNQTLNPQPAWKLEWKLDGCMGLKRIVVYGPTEDNSGLGDTLCYRYRERMAIHKYT